MDRIHTEALGEAYEHLSRANNLVRSAMLTATPVQKQAAKDALVELTAAATVLRRVAR